MTCNHCKGKVEQALTSIPGVYGVFVDLEGGVAEVDFDDKSVTVEALVEAVAASGYEARVAA
jgi:copper chaperone